MAVRILTGGITRTKTAGVSMNATYSSVSINKAGVQLMLDYFRSGRADFAQIIVDDERPKTFWIVICGPSDEGAHKLYKVSKNSRVLHSRLLFKELGIKGTVKKPLIFDGKLLAGRVDLDD